MKALLRTLSTLAVIGSSVALAYVAQPRVTPVAAPVRVSPAVGSVVSQIHGGHQLIAPVQRKGDLSSYVPSDPDLTWSPPPWFGADQALLAIPQMEEHWTGTGGPPVRSRSVFVFDVDAGEVIFEKNADDIRPVASITKLMSSLALISAEPNLEQEFCVGAEQYPTRSGATSRLSTGDCITGWDTLGAALVASDNRGAYGMAAAAGMGIDDFVGRMNSVAADLHMTHSSWSDPSGLEDENTSTARDIAKATLAVASHPLLRGVATAPYWDLHRSNRDSARRLYSTDRLVGREDIVIEAAKTGYTDTARYCFTTMLTTATGRHLVITILGGDGKMTRWADVQRILNWVDGGNALVVEAPSRPVVRHKTIRAKSPSRRRHHR